MARYKIETEKYKRTSFQGTPDDNHYITEKLAKDSLDAKAATDQAMHIGTTEVAINRASAALTLAGITLTTPDIGTPSAGTLTSCT